jgi:phosphoribosylanthranilate isomerase
VKIKICGLREAEHALAAANAGADFLGLIFAPSPRRLTLIEAEGIIRAVRDLSHPPQIVGLFANAPAAEVNDAATQIGLDMVQLAGDEDWGCCYAVTLPVIKTLHISPTTTSAEVLATIRQGLRARPDLRFLLDTRVGNASGGTGKTFDWELASEVAAQYAVAVAGGLTPVNVDRMVRIVHPWGVDVASGVETDGKKDIAKIKDFISAVRQAEQNRGSNG